MVDMRGPTDDGVMNDPIALADPVDVEVERERTVLATIQELHRRHRDRARRRANRLADEAAEATEDGIRDLVDDDGEVDAAIRAALVRQSADRAMHAIRRSTALDAMGDALAFGYTVDGDRQRLAVGRLTVIDDDGELGEPGEAVLVDWRAPAAMPFYRATPLDPLGVHRRRHLLYRRDPTADRGEDAEALTGYSDEVFDVDELRTSTGLRGEAAILAALDSPTEAHMRSVVATIQAEQDAVIRAPSDGALVVQGGPGTGKTVVALHRAAYLLYDQRAALSDTGVLIVGPSSQFLGYISNVLPSLGESGVISQTIPELYPGILRGGVESDEVSRLKGRATMADLLRAAVADRRRRPSEPLETWYGSRRVVIPLTRLEAIHEQAKRHATHNEGASAFHQGVIEALALAVFDPSFGTLADVADSFRRSRRLRQFVLRLWPTLTPEQALNDLLGTRSLLRSAARNAGLCVAETEILLRNRTPESELGSLRWTDADVPLLDELLELLGPVIPEADEERLRRDALDEFELAEQSDASGPGGDGLATSESVLDLDDGSEYELASLDDPDLDEPVYDESFPDDPGDLLWPRRELPDLRGFDAGTVD